MRLNVAGSKTAVLLTKEVNALEASIRNITIPNLLQTRFIGTYKCIMTPVNDVLNEILPEKLQQLNEAGLIDYYMRYYFDALAQKLLRTESGPQVLTFEELEAGFVVCMIPLVISIVAFCIEWMITLKKLIVFHFIFKKFFGVRMVSNQASLKIWLKKLENYKKIKDKKQKLKNHISAIQKCN